MSLGIRKDDMVIVIAGRDKGKKGKVLKVLPSKNRAVVEGVNLVKKHLRRRSEEEKGGIFQIPSPIHLSNLMLFCRSCNRGVRFKTQVLKDGTKVRICKKCGAQL